jgi:hypothetical protein
MAELTQNKNYLSPLSFQVTIDRSKFANLEYFCTKFSLPSIDASAAELNYKSIKTRFPADRSNYSEFTMSYMVSENMDNYIELYNWIDTNLYTNDYIQIDIYLNILSSHKNVNRQVRFIDCFPVTLGGLEFDMSSDVTYFTSDATFAYTKFEIIK